MAKTGEKRLDETQFMGEVQKFDFLFKDKYKMMNWRNLGVKLNLQPAEAETIFKLLEWLASFIDPRPAKKPRK